MKQLIPTAIEAIRRYNDYVFSGCYYDHEEFVSLVIVFADHLESPIELRRLVPCDKDGNPIKKPDRTMYSTWEIEGGLYKSDLEAYQKAQEDVWFDGFEIMSTSRDCTLLRCNSFDILFSEEGVTLLEVDKDHILMDTKISTYQDLCGKVYVNETYLEEFNLKTK